ncbi:sensor histidine kinase [Labilithrix luteola]|uniref:histidine kinase n=1 Tax=Labilithrix luteola TaxID=1391654 RepID=A0A0K1Q727_9BACT|nr:HAMP domain-containing sensor histidine kinase [Labilithrix luteola]AKV01636.1 sensor histidine kinase [Labilithrix luteola]
MADSSDPHRDLAGVLHDVSNALTVLLGWVGEARAPGASPEATAYALSIVEQRARLARDLARHAIGAPRIDEQRELAAVVEEVVLALEVEALRTGTRLVVRDSGPTALVSGALDVAQILTNLVLNALSHAPRDTVIDVNVVVEDERCFVDVTDEGPGVAPERRHSIFLGDSLRPGGTGVGLRHSRALARVWGGEVELVPGTSGEKGARFRVSWPRADAIPRPPVSTSRFTELAGQRVLVVEDDVAVTQLLEASLGARGAEITVASTADELTAALVDAPYDAVLVDFSPIKSDAQAALAGIRASSPNARILLITGNADALPAVFTDGTVELVRKPFEVGEIIRALRREKEC